MEKEKMFKTNKHSNFSYNFGKYAQNNCIFLENDQNFRKYENLNSELNLPLNSKLKCLFNVHKDYTIYFYC